MTGATGGMKRNGSNNNSNNSSNNNFNGCNKQNNSKQKNISKQRNKQRREPFQQNKSSSSSTSGTDDRRKYNNHSYRNHQVNRAALANVDDMESLHLEQAIRDLNCFEELLGGGGSHHDASKGSSSSNHRTFALEYLEGILTQWCRLVEEQQQQQDAKSAASRPSFASTAAMNAGSNGNFKTFAQAAASKPIVWQRAPPASVMGASNASPATSTSTTPTIPPKSSSPAAALIPFGSYRLGVHSTESDLDLLALAPPHVHRSDFFTSLVKLLRDDPRCQQVHPIPSAYTPVIKFELDCSTSCDEPSKTLQIDLVFARVADATKLIDYQKQKTQQQQQRKNGEKVDPATVEYHLDDTDLQDLDEAGVRSLNGARVSQMILEYVPDKAKFQTVLRAVKHWAVVQGIYSNVLGLLGGVNWAIMTAYVCKQYPSMDAASTLRVFFRTFALWQWNDPVMLFPTVADVPPITNVSKQTRAVHLPAWNPQTNPRDGMHMMPIITPAYPSMNSSYNVDMPQLRQIKGQLKHAYNVLEERWQRKNYKNNNIYRALFSPSNFFERHRHFIRVDVMAASEQDFVEWFRFVESRLRLLISNLDIPQMHACPFARFFTVPTTDPSAVPDSHQKCFFIGLFFHNHVEDMRSVNHLTLDFLHKVQSWEGCKAGMSVAIQHVLDGGIPLHVRDALHRRNQKSRAGGRCSSSVHKKDSSERSSDSENTAPATDDEEDDSSCCLSVEKLSEPEQLQPQLLSNSPDLSSPTKKCRVVNHHNKLALPPLPSYANMVKPKIAASPDGTL